MIKRIVLLAAIGSGVLFRCGSGGNTTSLINPATGQQYKTAVIGSKTWMAENLNHATPNGSWCYDNDNSNCDKYGRLYDWETAMTVCPVGWHLPTREEWDRLAELVGGTKASNSENNWIDSGKKLKSKSGWNKKDDGDNGNGTDDYGFSALPGGYRNPEGGFGAVGGHGHWWTATEGSDGHAHIRFILYNLDTLYEYDYVKDIGFSVRCVMD